MFSFVNFINKFIFLLHNQLNISLIKLTTYFQFSGSTRIGYDCNGSEYPLLLYYTDSRHRNQLISIIVRLKNYWKVENIFRDSAILVLKFRKFWNVLLISLIWIYQTKSLLIGIGQFSRNVTKLLTWSALPAVSKLLIPN